jgi:hypothetical protein
VTILLTVTPVDGEFVEARCTFFGQTDADTGEMYRDRPEFRSWAGKSYEEAGV